MTGSPDLIVRARQVVFPDGTRPATLRIEGGRFREISDGEPAEAPPGVECLDVDDGALVFPGLVDTHVHVNEPGREEWEGFETATRAAVKGGITTLVDMPLNSSPVTVTPEALGKKIAAAEGKCRCDVGFWGGVIPGAAGNLEALWDGGVLGFKAFLCPSGISEFPRVKMDVLTQVAPVLKKLGAPLLVHAEIPERLMSPAVAMKKVGGTERTYLAYLASRPDRAETDAIELCLKWVKNTGCALHVVHLATSDGLELLCKARKKGLPVTVETCPHYLTFLPREVADGATMFKCAPPIRGTAHREGLWEGLLGGDIDLVVTDHSPCPPELKKLDTGDFFEAWGGIASLELSFSAVFGEAVERGASMEQIASWMSGAPARLAGLSGKKGGIAPGLDADFFVFDPEASARVSSQDLVQRHKFTPYEGRVLRGAVRRTFLRGVCVYEEGGFPGENGGRCLGRESRGRG